MDKVKQSHINNEILDDAALDADIIELLAEAQPPADISIEMAGRMRNDVLGSIKKEKAKQEKEASSKGFETLLAHEGEWIEAMPGAQFKILHDDGNGLDGLLSYLIKLEPGFTMEGHNHPFDEECLMLEGDLTLGEHTLNKGDFHFANEGVHHGNLSTINGCTAFIRGALPV